MRCQYNSPISGSGSTTSHLDSDRKYMDISCSAVSEAENEPDMLFCVYIILTALYTI